MAPSSFRGLSGDVSAKISRSQPRLCTSQVKNPFEGGKVLTMRNLFQFKQKIGNVLELLPFIS